MEIIRLRAGEEFIKLSQAMKKASLVDSGAEAKMRVRLGEVTIDGRPEERPGKKLFPGDCFVCDKETYRIETSDH
ncbi:MAG: RNA-binding S4 domain-containing protein [Lachnospiraceae bacterium]|nr:RNA-binding S4 domain-containing protein [Lachnospiraceae bacterium]